MIPLGSVDAYLAEVRRAMAGMSPAVREDILRELRGHLTESVAANGGNIGASIAAMGPATEVGRRYRSLYGYGGAYKFLFAAIAFLLAVPSIPVLVSGPESLFPSSFSILFLIAAAGWLMWVSVAAGSRSGLLAAIAAFAGRALAFGLAAAALPGAEASAGGIGLVLAVSASLVLLGWLPGTAKQTWSGPSGEI